MRPMQRQLRFRRPPQEALPGIVFRQRCDPLIDAASGNWFCRTHAIQGVGRVALTRHCLGVDEAEATKIVAAYRKDRKDAFRASNRD